MLGILNTCQLPRDSLARPHPALPTVFPFTVQSHHEPGTRPLHAQMVAFSYGGVPPPMEEAAFSDFLRTLPDDAIWRALQEAEPVTPRAHVQPRGPRMLQFWRRVAVQQPWLAAERRGEALAGGMGPQPARSVI